MLIPKKLKLNKFRHVDIPKNREYFARYGNFNTMDINYTGDDVAPIGQSKIDQIMVADAEYRQYLSKQDTPVQ